MVESRAFSDVCHMCVEFWCVFTEDPGQSVEPMGVCLFANQTQSEREREESKEICVKERQPEESKCFDK